MTGATEKGDVTMSEVLLASVVDTTKDLKA
jgi:hypothetical protein